MVQIVVVQVLIRFVNCYNMLYFLLNKNQGFIFKLNTVSEHFFSTINLLECAWFGTAPFCDGECPSDMYEFRRDNQAHWVNQNSLKTVHWLLSMSLESLAIIGNSFKGFGAPCFNGEKAYCCRRGRIMKMRCCNTQDMRNSI